MFGILSALILLGVSVFFVKFVIPAVILAWAKRDSKFSPFQSKPSPGEFYVMSKGEPTGPFALIVSSVNGWRHDASQRRFVPDHSVPEGYLENIGVVWVGFWRRLLFREVRYDKWEKLEGENTDWGLVSKTRGTEKKGPAVYFIYNMAVRVKKAETSDNFPVNALITFTLQVTKPEQALFFSGGFEIQSVAAVAGESREYIGVRNINKLRKEQRVAKAGGASPLVDRIKKLELLDLYGVEIIDARFVEFDLVTGDKDEKMAEATRALGIARLKKEAEKVLGEGEKLRLLERAEGERAMVAAYASHPVGGQVAMAEAIKEAKPKAIGAGILANISTDDE